MVDVNKEVPEVAPEETPEVTPEGQEEESSKKAKQLAEQLAKREQDLANLTEEIKEVRGKKQELEEALKAKEIAETRSPEETEVEKVVLKIQQERDRKLAESNQKEAEEQFKNSTAEFRPDNDPGGIKYKAFLKEKQKFNFDGLTTKEEFSARFKEIYDYMNRGKSQDDDEITPTPAIPNSPAPAKGVDTIILTQREKQVIDRLGWTRDKYIKLKQKQPVYIESLLKNV